MTGSPLDRVYLSRRAFVAAAVAGRVRAGRLWSFDQLSGESTGVPGGRHRRCRGGASAHRAHRHCLADAAAGHHRPGRHPGADPGLRQCHPGPLIRASVGDELAVTVTNRLDRPTSVHWHGIALRNDMDGAAPATPDIDAGPTSPTGSRFRIRAPTGRIRTPVWTPIPGCIYR